MDHKPNMTPHILNLHLKVYVNRSGIVVKCDTEGNRDLCRALGDGYVIMIRDCPYITKHKINVGMVILCAISDHMKRDTPKIHQKNVTRKKTSHGSGGAPSHYKVF